MTHSTGITKHADNWLDGLWRKTKNVAQAPGRWLGDFMYGDLNKSLQRPGQLSSQIVKQVTNITQGQQTLENTVKRQMEQAGQAVVHAPKAFYQIVTDPWARLYQASLHQDEAQRQQSRVDRLHRRIRQLQQELQPLEQKLTTTLGGSTQWLSQGELTRLQQLQQSIKDLQKQVAVTDETAMDSWNKAFDDLILSQHARYNQPFSFGAGFDPHSQQAGKVLSRMSPQALKQLMQRMPNKTYAQLYQLLLGMGAGARLFTGATRAATPAVAWGLSRVPGVSAGAAQFLAPVVAGAGIGFIGQGVRDTLQHTVSAGQRKGWLPYFNPNSAFAFIPGFPIVNSHLFQPNVDASAKRQESGTSRIKDIVELRTSGYNYSSPQMRKLLAAYATHLKNKAIPQPDTKQFLPHLAANFAVRNIPGLTRMDDAANVLSQLGLGVPARYRSLFTVWDPSAIAATWMRQGGSSITGEHNQLKGVTRKLLKKPWEYWYLTDAAAKQQQQQLSENPNVADAYGNLFIRSHIRGIQAPKLPDLGAMFTPIKLPTLQPGWFPGLSNQSVSKLNRERRALAQRQLSNVIDAWMSAAVSSEVGGHAVKAPEFVQSYKTQLQSCMLTAPDQPLTYTLVAKMYQLLRERERINQDLNKFQGSDKAADYEKRKADIERKLAQFYNLARVLDQQRGRP